MVQEVKPLNTRARILDVASRLFFEQGYQATGINQIIAEAKVAKASFYHHFPSKEELGLAYLEKLQHERSARMCQMIEKQKDPKRRLTTLFDYLEELMTSSNFGGCHSLNMVSEFPSPGGRVRKQISARKTSLRNYIFDLTRAALPADADEKAISNRADAIYILFEGAIMESRVHNDLWPIEAARKAVASLFK